MVGGLVLSGGVVALGVAAAAVVVGVAPIVAPVVGGILATRRLRDHIHEMRGYQSELELPHYDTAESTAGVYRNVSDL